MEKEKEIEVIAVGGHILKNKQEIESFADSVIEYLLEYNNKVLVIVPGSGVEAGKYLEKDPTKTIFKAADELQKIIGEKIQTALSEKNNELKIQLINTKTIVEPNSEVEYGILNEQPEGYKQIGNEFTESEKDDFNFDLDEVCLLKKSDLNYIRIVPSYEVKNVELESKIDKTNDIVITGIGGGACHDEEGNEINTIADKDSTAKEIAEQLNSTLNIITKLPVVNMIEAGNRITKIKKEENIDFSNAKNEFIEKLISNAYEYDYRKYFIKEMTVKEAETYMENYEIEGRGSM